MEVVLLFPGQGSQKPGMGKDLAAAFPPAADAFRQADDALGEPLSSLCFDGPADTLTLTHNAQPALLAHGAAVWAVTRDALRGKVRAAAGHSLGEFTAYCAAGAIALPDAIRLVRRRGALMYESGLARPGAMAAILGDTNRSVDEICAEASEAPEGGLVVPANYNSPGRCGIRRSRGRRTRDGAVETGRREAGHSPPGFRSVSLTAHAAGARSLPARAGGGALVGSVGAGVCQRHGRAGYRGG
jgi:malonyl CoA-acyl carrier protein transacylase